MLAFKIVSVFISGIAVGVLYRIPRSLFLYGSFNAAVSWLVMYGLLTNGANIVAANFAGGVAVGLVAETFARTLRKPATIFIIPGFIPLVPGGDAYNTMRFMVESKFSEAVMLGVRTMLVAGAIAFGIFVSATVYRLVVNYRAESGAQNAEHG